MYDPYKTHEKAFLSKNFVLPPEVFCKERFYLKFGKVHTKTPALESLFNKVTGLKTCIFTKRRHQRKCFLAKFSKILRAPVLKNICERVKASQKNKSIACIRKILLDGKRHN